MLKNHHFTSQVPDGAQFVINTLQNAGHKAFLVGGCVRDCMLGVTPKDWDITTSALPEETKRLFKKTFDTGISHGTVTVIETIPIEVTTFRTDGTYTDNRRPDRVHFSTNISDDLSRRDFTINAMAWNPTDGLQDPFSGLSDLQTKIIRTVGDPLARFKEDALRMLRAVRFSAVLGFEIEKSTSDAIHILAPSILNISSERIRDELCKILLSYNPTHISKLRDLGLLVHILPEFNACFDQPQNHPWHIYDVGNHILKVLSEIRSNDNSKESLLYLRLAALLHDIGKIPCHSKDAFGVDHFYGHAKVGAEMSRVILRRLRFDNKTISEVSSLIQYHDLNIPTSEKMMRKYLNLMGEDFYPLFIQLRLADSRGQNLEKSGEVAKMIASQQVIFDKVISEKQCFSLKQLAVDGKDILALAARSGADGGGDCGADGGADGGATNTIQMSGPKIGFVLNKLLQMVQNDPSLNTKVLLLELAAEEFIE